MASNKFDSVRVAALLASGALISGFLTSCAGHADDTEPNLGEQSDARLAAALAEASSDDHVSDAQKAILAKSEVTFQDYELALGTYFSCVEKQGLKVHRGTTQKWQGVDIIDYTIESGSSDSELALAEQIQDSCYRSEAELVSQYWGGGTVQALKWQEQFRIDMVPFLRDCLTEQGIDIPNEASFDELAQIDLSRELDDGSYCYAQGQEKFE